MLTFKQRRHHLTFRVTNPRRNNLGINRKSLKASVFVKCLRKNIERIKRITEQDHLAHLKKVKWLPIEEMFKVNKEIHRICLHTQTLDFNLQVLTRIEMILTVECLIKTHLKTKVYLTKEFTVSLWARNLIMIELLALTDLDKLGNQIDILVFHRSLTTKVFIVVKEESYPLTSTCKRWITHH